MSQAIRAKQLAATLQQAGFRLIQSRLLNVRTGKSWLHRRVICKTEEGKTLHAQIYATN